MGLLGTLLLLAVVGVLWSDLSKLKRRVRQLEEQLAPRSLDPVADRRAAAPTPLPAPAAPAAAPAPASPVPAPASRAAEAGDAIEPVAAAVASAPPRNAASLPLHAALGAAGEIGNVGSSARVAAPPVDAKPSWQVSFFDLLRNNLFAVAGIGLLLLGFVFLFHSIEWGQLLSPMAKVSLAWAAAAGLGVAGVRLSARNALWGQVVQGGAAAIGYLATYAGASGYAVLSPWTALGLFTLISALLVHRALKEDSKVLAGVGFLGAYAAPLLAMYGMSGLLFNLIYGLIVTAFALWVSHTRRWQEIGVHAHACAAGLAALATMGASHEPALPAWQQQALLLAYLAQFVGWALIWANRYGTAAAPRVPGSSSRRLAWEMPILIACFSMSIVIFLAMQSWLLAPTPFMAVAFVTAALLGLGASKAFPQPALRETAWVLSAFSVAAGLVQGDLARSVASLGLFVEGAILTLSTREGSIVRRWVARGLVAAGAVSVLGVPALWPAVLLFLAALALSLQMDRVGRIADARLAAVVTIGGAAACAYRHVAFGPDLWPEFTLALLLATVLGYGLRFLKPSSAQEGDGSALDAPAAPASPVTAIGPVAEPVPVPAIHAGATALAWLGLLPVLPDLPGALGLIALVTPVVFGAVMALMRLRAPMGPRVAEAIKALLWLACLLPALVAYGIAHPWSVVALLAVVGTATFAQGLWALPIAAPIASRGPITPANVSLVGLLGSAMPLVLAALPSALTTQPVWWLAAIAFYAALATWWMRDDNVPAQGRQVGAAALAVAMGYVVIRGATDAPDLAFPLAWRSYLLPVALAAVGVVFLFLSTRRGQRLAWQVSAAVCAVAMAKLLLSLGSWAFSPMGIVGSLLGMGALFLMAGYLAPQPPARDIPPAAPTA